MDRTTEGAVSPTDSDIINFKFRGLFAFWGLVTSGTLAIGFPRIPPFDFHSRSCLNVPRKILKV